MILHPIHLDEDIFVIRVGTLGRESNAVAVRVDLDAKLEVDDAVTIEVDAPASTGSVAPLVRLPAVWDAVTVRVFNVPAAVETFGQGQLAGPERPWS